MGKCMRKSKNSAEISVMEVSHHNNQSSLFIGVRTRAKTLALQRLGISPALAPSSSGGSYLELRNRRLEKHTIVGESKRQKQVQKGNPVSNPNPNFRARSRLSVVSVDSCSVVGSGQLEKAVVDRNSEEIRERSKNESTDVADQASHGENVLEFEDRERDRREGTPCSLLRDPDAIRTPGSTNRPTSSTEGNGAAHNSTPRHIPTANDMDEFFSGPEVQQQKQFIEKYNFDPVNEKPLPGRYEWVKVDQ